MASKYLPLFFFFLYLFSTTKSQSQQANVSTGSTLYTNSTPNFWLSPSGHFAFGFYPVGNGFKFGIWLVGTPKNTIVWTARRNDPVVSPGATLLFSADGMLLLRSSLGQVSIAETSLRAYVASVLDSGNFVLYNSSLQIVWASFDYPTDTLLVGQKLVVDNSLYSSVSQTNHSTGDFKLRMQSDGNLVAFPVKSLAEGKYSYWSSSTTNTGKHLSLSLAADGRLYLQNSSGFSIKNLTDGENPVNNRSLYRATFNVDGILRLYQHQIGIIGSLSSSILWTAINESNRCMVKGICGLNSYCTLNGAGTACLCPGFDFVDPKQASYGCKLNFTVEKACLGNKDNENHIISPLDNTLWERDEYDALYPLSEENCSKACLEGCHCVVAMFRDQICFKQKLPLRYGRRNSSFPTKTLFKIKSPAGDPDTKKLGKEILILGVVLIAISFLVFILSGYLVYKHHNWGYKMISTGQASPSDVIQEINLRSFS